MTRKLKRPIALLLSVAMLVTMMFTGAFSITASAATTGDVTFTALSCSEPSAGEDFGFANLFDGKYTSSNGTKWYINEYTGYCYIFFKASEAVHVNGYSLYTGDSFGDYKLQKANPEKWTLYASNDFKSAENADYNSAKWQKLDVVEGADLPETDYTEYKRELASQTTIKYEYFILKLEMTGNNKWTNFSNSGWSLQLGEVVMDYSTCDHTYVDGTCSSCGMTQPTGAPDKGDGSKSNPFEIGTLEQLEWFSAYVGDNNFVENSYAYAKLVDDITLNEGLLDENGDLKLENPKSWSAIENFKGEFDGQNHTISGLYVLGYVNDYKFGLFSSITGAKISNVKVVDSYFDVCNYIGGIVSNSSYGTIDNCHFSGTIKSGGDCIGGIVGINAENSIVKNCTFNGKVKGTNYVGGIAGKSYSDTRYSKTATTIRHCTSNGSVLGEQFIGGICGSVAQYCNDENYPPKAENRSRVSYCKNYAEVTSYFSNSTGSVFYTSDAGGIVGEAYQAVVESSSNYGTVTSSKNNCGGIVGSMNVNYREDCCTEVTGCYNGGTVQFKKYEGVWDREETITFGGLVGSASSNSIIKNCYTDGVVIGTGYYHGVLFGRTSSTTVSNCYANKGLRKYMNNEGHTYVAEDWFDAANADYPGCEFIDASAEDSIIKTGELACKLGSEWGQTVDAGNKYTIKEEKPVVGGAAVFYSNKNGRYHNHTGLNYNSNSWCAYCYNADMGNAEYKPKQVDGVYQISTAEELCWFAHNCANSTEDAVLTNDISINNRVVNEDGTLAVDKSNLIMWYPIGGNRNAYYYDYQCYKGHFDGQGHTVSGLFLEEGYDGMGFFGGIDKDGVVENLNITDSYFAYSGSTYGYVGGVCGINRGKINNCTFSGVVTGKNYVGGIVGGIIGVTGYALKYDVEITNCTNYGKISGEYNVGGVCGYSEKRGSIINCSNKIGNNAKIGSIYSGEITGKSNLGGVCGTAYGKTSECYNECTVTGDGDYIGGIVGVTDHQTYTDDNGVSTSKSVLEKSVNTRALYPAEWDSFYSPKYSGPISGKMDVGGVCGGVYSEGIIRNCYNINQQVCGVKSGITNIGGLVGHCFSKSVVESCYNYCADFTNETAVMIVNTPQDKYFFGSFQDAECIFKNNYYYIATLTEGCDSQASGASFATKEQFASGEVAYHAQLGQNIDSDSDYPKLAYPTFDGPTVYRNITKGITCEYGYFDECEYSNTDNQTLPYLEHAEGEVYDGYCDYCHIVPIEPIQDEKGYKIGGAGHLIWLSQHTDILTADSKVYLANDIDFNKEQVSVIGNSEHPFTGTFDGEGHTIKNYSVTVNDECPNNQGLFGYVKDGTVKNVTIDASNLYFKYSGYTATTLKGSEYSTFIAHLDNSTVESCNVTMYAIASAYGYFKRVAAVAAIADNNSVVKNCTASGYFSNSTQSIKLEECGSIVGRLSNSSVENCTSSFRYNTPCYNLTKDAANNIAVYNLGGIVGCADGNSQVKDCTNKASSMSFNNYGVILDNIGGIVGGIESSDDNYTTVENCVNNAQINVNERPYSNYVDVTSASNIGGIVGQNNAAGAIITKSKNNGRVYSYTSENKKTTASNVGGILGGAAANTTVSECCNIGEVKSAIKPFNFAGVVGCAADGVDLTIENSANLGNITLTQPTYTGGADDDYSSCYAAGILGYGNLTEGGSLVIDGCYTAGTITSYITGTASVIGYLGGESSAVAASGTSFYVAQDDINAVNGTVADNMTTTAVKAEDVASGRLCYLLNGDQSAITWGQTLDGAEKQEYPVLGGAQVYQNTTYNNCEYDFTHNYANTQTEPNSPIDHADSDSDGYCDYCENIMSANLTLTVPKDGEAMPSAFDSLPDGISVSDFAVDSEDTTADYNTTYTVTANVSAAGKVFLNTPTFSINGTAVTATKNEDGSYAVSFDFKPTIDLAVTANMKSGAAIRLTNGNGLRFYTLVDSAKISKLQALGATVELGTLIAPKNLLGDDDLTFDLDESKYINVKYEAIQNGAYYWHKDVDGQIAGSIVNIKESNTSFSTANGNIARDFVGRGYVKVTLNGTTVITYADYAEGNIENNTRSLAYVANSLKNDTAKYGELDNATKALVDNWASKLTNE